MISSRQYYSLRSFLLVVSVVVSTASAQDSLFTDGRSAGLIAFVALSAGDTVYSLPHEFILAGSELVLLDSLHVLERDRDYRLDPRRGLLYLQSQSLREWLSDSLPHTLVVTYRALPLVFRPEYFLYEVNVAPDEEGREVTLMASVRKEPLPTDWFGPGLEKSGSIVRGFTVGSNRDLSLTSGFRMQLSGNLARDIDIVAALTDENTPLQPEGTTQTLREVDKVFIELRGPHYGATLGDFNVEVPRRQGGEFGQLFRKVQGARGNLRFGSAGDAPDASVSVAGAALRGKFHTNEFRGAEGNQGPYRLTGKNGEQRLVIVAGSERVYLNGELMQRGETNDYTIDYAAGEVMFTTRRLMTSASRIVIDFEYSEKEYGRNLLAGSASAPLLDGRLALGMTLAQEADDPQTPIDADLSEEGREKLRNAGSDRLAASLPGARFVGRDSLTLRGLGQYVKVDTLLAGKPYVVYRYAPGHVDALYSVAFSPVDHVPPDSAGYVRLALGHFQFAGLGQGNFLPLRLLPLPQLHRVAGVNASATPLNGLEITGEYALSEMNRNRLSSIDGTVQTGTAYRLGVRFRPRNLTIGESRFGDLDVSLLERRVGRTFVALDRFNEVEHARRWDLADDATNDERVRELSMSYRPNRSMSLSGSYGSLGQGEFFQSTRTSAAVVVNDSTVRSLRLEREDIRTEQQRLNVTTSWVRQRAIAEHAVWSLRPSIRVENERREVLDTSSDMLQPGGFRFLELAPRLEATNVPYINASAELQVRREDSVLAGTYREAFKSVTQLYSAELKGIKDVSSSLSLSLRDTRFQEEFRLRGNADADVVLVRSHSRFTPLARTVDATLLYEFSNQRAARLERVFVRVPRGTGNYRYRGDLNNNGIADDDEFEVTRFDGDYVVLYLPTQQLFPVQDLRTSVRIRLEPARMISRPTTAVEKVASAVSSETLMRIEEKSRETSPGAVARLDLSKFLNDWTTLAGTNLITQDLHLFERSADFSFRLRWSQRRGLIQLINGTERSFHSEYSVRVRSQLLPEIGNQTDVSSRIDRVGATAGSYRERDLRIVSGRTEFSYRPEPVWEVAFHLELARVEDRFRVTVPTADINEQAVRVTYSALGVGQVRAEFRREEVLLTRAQPDPQRPFPYEFTAGKVAGKSFLWNLAFEYRFAHNMQVSAQYHGRSEGKRTPVHQAQVEARAFF